MVCFLRDSAIPKAMPHVPQISIILETDTTYEERGIASEYDKVRRDPDQTQVYIGAKEIGTVCYC